MTTSNITNTTTSNTYTLSNATTTAATTATINYNGNLGTTTIGTDYIYNTNW